MLMPCDCAKLLQGSVRGSKVVAEKLWCRVYGMTDITHSSPSLGLSHMVHSLHIKENRKQDDVFDVMAVIACSWLMKDKCKYPLILTFMTLKLYATIRRMVTLMPHNRQCCQFNSSWGPSMRITSPLSTPASCLTLHCQLSN